MVERAPRTGAPTPGAERGGDETTAAEQPEVVVVDAARPEVSIVVVTYGTGTVVLDALRAVVAHTALPVEVVVVDNPPDDDRRPTRELLRARTAGLRLLTPDANLGFGGGNELGVAATSGELVCFLNPDVVVAPGWLEPLVAALDDPDVAIAGPVMLNPDGSIQEAGRVVYRDGWTGAVAGRDLLTGDESQLFTRDVDYVSAACWVVRRREHVDRGGFDRRYHPAFFEDVDYALRVEAAGQRSRLVADVPVVHHHGAGGAGRDADPSAARRAFLDRWADRLLEQAPRPETAAQARAARDRLAAARVAWVDRSGSPSARRRGLAQAVAHAEANPRDRVTFVTPDPSGLDVPGARRSGVEVVVGEVDTVAAERFDESTSVRVVWSPRASLRDRTARWWVAAAGVVALAGVVLRTVVLRSPAGELNGDEAYTGIQAFAILDGATPVTLGGAVYTLPFESYLYAPFVAVFGAHIVPLKLLSTLFWVAAAVAVAVVGTRLRRRRTGLVAAALLWVAPGGMLLLSVTAYAAYASGMLVTVLAFLLATRLLDVDAVPGWTFGLFGALAGFGVWLHPMYLATLLPIVAAVLLVRRTGRAWAWTIGGGIVGCGPLLLWNAVNSFPSLDPPVDLEDSATDRLRTFAVDLLPRAFGLRDGALDWETPVAPVLYALLIAGIVVGLVTTVRSGTGRSRWLLPLVVVAAFPIMAAFESLIYAADGRYGVITYPFLVLALAVAVDEAMGRRPPRSIAVAAGVTAVWLAGFVAPGVRPLLDRAGDPNDAVGEVVDRLDDAGIEYVNGSYWGVLPVEFAGDRRIVGAVTPDWPVRFPERQRIVEAAPAERVAFVFRLDNEAPSRLWLAPDAYRREEIGGFVLYLPLPVVVGAGADTVD